MIIQKVQQDHHDIRVLRINETKNSRERKPMWRPEPSSLTPGEFRQIVMEILG